MDLSIVINQVGALLKRYLIHQYRSPIWSILRIFIYPAVMLITTYYILIGLKSFEGSLGDSKIIEGPFIEFLLTFLTCWPFYHFGNWLIVNKTTEMKSLMLTMGLKQVSWYLSNIICFLAFNLPPILIFATLLAVYRMSEVAVIVICVYTLFAIHLTGVIFAITSVINTKDLSVLFFALVLIERTFHYGVTWLMKKTDDNVQGFILFAASLSPYESVRIFHQTHSCTDCKQHLQEYQKQELVSEPYSLLLVAMSFWTLVAFAVARYFDEVCPWQTDTAIKGPLCCFKSLDSDHDLDTEARSISFDPKYFERADPRGETGIRIRGVVKVFKKIPVVNEVTYNIQKGETTLLLGHNGAGKTTLMNIILGKLTPDQGKVLIESGGQLKNADNLDGLALGFCPQNSINDEALNVRQHLDLFYSLKSANLPSWECEAHIKQTLDDVNLTDHMHKCPSELSGGMKRKLSLAMAFVGKSSILILDEPSSGLDPDSRVFIWNAIRRYRQERTVLLSTQHMEEADYLGDRIAIMSEGKIICSGSTNFLNNLYGGFYKLRIECRGSKKRSIISFVQKHFPQTKVPESEQLFTPVAGTDPLQDIVMELVDDRSRDSELHLIKMLEEIETNSKELSIVSFGLKSSSIEDVMLSTSRHQVNVNPDESTRISLSSRSKYDKLTSFSRAPEMGAFPKQLEFFYALFVKHLNSIMNDYRSYIFFRVILAQIANVYTIYSLKDQFFKADFELTIVPAIMIMHFAHYAYHERNSKFKIMQLTSQANIFVYWFAQFIGDLVSIILLVMVADLALCLVFNGEYVTSPIIVGTIIAGSTLLFAISGAFLAYVVSMLVGDQYLLILITGVIGTSLLKLISLFIKRDISLLMEIVNYMFVTIFPSDALSYIHFGLVSQGYIASSSGFSLTKPRTPSPVVYGLCSLVAQIIIYGAILIIIEYNNIDVNQYIKSLFCRCNRGESVKLRSQDVDGDVLEEAKRTLSLLGNSREVPISRENFSLLAGNLQKSYHPGVKVIDKLSFTVNQRECFGLLGVNGAGKSTTFAMLVGETAPDYGDIWMNGHFLKDNINKYRQKVGYDPQSNPEMFLSAEVALTLMARLRRVSERSIPSLVNAMLEVLDMNEHRKKIARYMSGGTKRKLALGMSLIGSPNLIALDEPTAGIDPLARRGIWLLLKALRMHSGSSIIISSHALEECEAICDRISIMARGSLRCIGTFLHLRSKFSQGCTVRIQFVSNFGNEEAPSSSKTASDSRGKIVQEIGKNLTMSLGPTVKLTDTNVNSATFNISDKTMKHSTLFKVLRGFKTKHPNTFSYMVNDSSLEDIFIALAREQQELDKTSVTQTGGCCSAC